MASLKLFEPPLWHGWDRAVSPDQPGLALRTARVDTESAAARRVLAKRIVPIVESSRRDLTTGCKACRVNFLPHHQSLARGGTALRVAADDEARIARAASPGGEFVVVGVRRAPGLLLFARPRQTPLTGLVAAAVR